MKRWVLWGVIFFIGCYSTSVDFQPPQAPTDPRLKLKPGHAFIACDYCGGFYSKLHESKKDYQVYHVDILLKTGDVYIKMCFPCYLKIFDRIYGTNFSHEFKKAYQQNFEFVYTFNFNIIFGGEKDKKKKILDTEPMGVGNGGNQIR